MIGTLGPSPAHAVDAAGAIYLLDWLDGFAVRKAIGGGWSTLPTLAAPAAAWAFAVAPDGRPLVARTLWEGPSGGADPTVEVDVLEGGAWRALGDVLPGAPWWFPWQTPAKPALAVDEAGGVLVLVDAGGQHLYRLDPAETGWAALGPDFPLASGYGEFEPGVVPAGAGRVYAISTWIERVDANLGCYDDGAQVARLAEGAFTDLGELKLDRRTSDLTGCPHASLRHAALAVDDAGGARASFVELGVGATTATAHVVRLVAGGWVEEAAWPGVAPGPRISLATLSPGVAWLAITEPRDDGSRLRLRRDDGAGWRTFGVLDHPAPDAEASFVCADEAGNPVIAVIAAPGGQLLAWRP